MNVHRSIACAFLDPLFLRRSHHNAQARDNVTTFVFAPPPCISKGVRGLHRFTTSFVMGGWVGLSRVNMQSNRTVESPIDGTSSSIKSGDDMVPRANAASLERLEKRLLDYVSEGGGGGGGIYLDYARSWVKGVVGATLQQVVTHQVGGKDGEEADREGEDETELTLPGRVYYIKPRKLHGGATIKEVRATDKWGAPGPGKRSMFGSHLLFAYAHM